MASIHLLPPVRPLVGRAALLALVLAAAVAACAPSPEPAPAPAPATAPAPQATERGPRSQPGTGMGLYAPDQHANYDGHFVITGRAVHQVGTFADPSPWDHMGDDAAHVRPVDGTIEIDVDERANTGTFRADLTTPEGRFVVEMDRFQQFSPCQDGGIAAFIYEHGDSGCGDANWPKSLLYVAGWGIGHATLDGRVRQQDGQVHFMVTQGMRDRRTLRVFPPVTGSDAGAVNPAAMQVDFYIRSPETDDANRPNRRVFDHFFGMEVTWR